MNYKCSNCGGAALFDPISGRMKCTQCGNIIESTFTLKAKEDIVPEEPEEEKSSVLSGKERARLYRETKGMIPDTDMELPQETYMDINIYRCTSCGAELMINDKEASTFCAFCGQPTIVFDRVSRELKPNYIIPFAYSEQEAVERIRDKLVHKTFIPNRIKNPDIDQIRGIYIPYWMYTSYIRMHANLTARVPTGRTYRTRGGRTREEYETVEYYRDMDCTYQNVTADASKRLSNMMSERLEPYYMNAMRPFDAKYLSGFYADKYDVPMEDMAIPAHNRIRGFMEQELISSCQGESVRVVQSKEKEYRVDSIEYALLPAWFMTFWYENELYTVMVNGQTGKVVGNVPVDKKKALWWLIIAAIIGCGISVPLVTIGITSCVQMLHTEAGWQGLSILLMIISYLLVIFGGGIINWKKYKKDQERFKSKNTLQYVKNRQDKTWVR